MRRGRLYFHPELLTAQIQWNEEESVALYSQLSSGGRAMEFVFSLNFKKIKESKK